jgi:hypothetical protein
MKVSKPTLSLHSERQCPDSLASSKTFRKRFGRFPDKSRVQIYE